MSEDLIVNFETKIFTSLKEGLSNSKMLILLHPMEYVLLKVKKFFSFLFANLIFVLKKQHKDLSFSLKPGQNLLVTGSAGSGKTSLFRILGELWPVNYGTVVKPRKEDIIFVPQIPYFVIGTLRDQVIYPHTVEDMRNLNVTNEDLDKLMEIVDPSKTILSQWKWDDVNDWFSILPLISKQRLAMARIFYHRPLFAMLDQSTSMMYDEVVSKIYVICKQLGIT